MARERISDNDAGFLGNLGRFGMAALAINVCYYTSLLLGLMRLWSAAKRNKRA
jgi:hypothetical protein